MSNLYSKRHYQDIADLVRAMPNTISKEELTILLKIHFAKDNYRFKPQRFQDAIYPTSKQIEELYANV